MKARKTLFTILFGVWTWNFTRPGLDLTRNGEDTCDLSRVGFGIVGLPELFGDTLVAENVGCQRRFLFHKLVASFFCPDTGLRTHRGVLDYLEILNERRRHEMSRKHSVHFR